MLRPFTKENAAEMARRSVKAREERRAQRKAMAAAIRLESSPDCDQARNRRVFAQIRQCDEMIDECRDPDTFVKLTAAKERLWRLVFPTAGVLKPANAPRRRQSTSLPEPSPGA